ncbi:MAG: lipid-A-disaccharide synthase [Gammaproteobacteria bacterium]|jgi:lipid-A-disaccharide synthase|nr:lipid-A-disaccharide synthase [Gammaproteobacteria bacterium]MBT5862963.1 lipid-A-disaccharide synthase [Gammaproteobacteria bacterium]MBT7236237.1 lipid-A-disaccharide synthase [Gammaproteobacteria bacterium]|tara:strand:+ start:8244 stop:9380 length:1137 start_codon:yes stop_codon:yes gene_type:complete
MSTINNIFVVAGESSGDQHAANYVKEHKKVNPEAVFTAIGQQELNNSGANIIFNSEEISVIGIIEVISKYSKIRKALNIAYNHIINSKPDLIVLVDYVEFNLKIARFAKKYNIPVLFYVAPQVWAWREKRIKKIVEVVDQLAVIFPFEERIFKKYTQNVTYVGHPLADDPRFKPTDLKYNHRMTTIGIFPGSRESEIRNNLYRMIDSIRIVKNDDIYSKNIKIFYANATAKKLLVHLLPEGWSALLVDGKDLSEIKKCQKVITASGTVTLELAMMNIPMIIMYRLSPFTYFIMKHLVKLKYIGLVNLILGDSLGSQPVVKEFIQPDYSDEVQVMVELQRIDNDISYREKIEDGYNQVRKTLKPGAAMNVAKIANKMIR